MAPRARLRAAPLSRFLALREAALELLREALDRDVQRLDLHVEVPAQSKSRCPGQPETKPETNPKQWRPKQNSKQRRPSGATTAVGLLPRPGEQLGRKAHRCQPAIVLEIELRPRGRDGMDLPPQPCCSLVCTFFCLPFL